MTRSTRWTTLLSLVLIGGFATSAQASPTMVRLGYGKCSTCHLAPQGAGPLTDYGKGIDDAQSLSARDYQPDSPPWARRLWRSDVRLLTSASLTTADESSARPTPPSWLRIFFRNSVEVSSHNRVAATMHLQAPQGDVERLWNSKPVIDATVAWEYRPAEGLTLSVSRDRLPRGIELGETRTLLQDSGDADRFPTQLKALLESDRFHMTTYAYAPGSAGAWDRRARGAGARGGVHLFSNHVTLGVSTRWATSEIVVRQTVGAYALLGFGKWGILAEHELARRTPTSSVDQTRRRHAGYTQVFFAPKEWLVASLVGEQSDDMETAQPRLFRWRPELQARLSRHITVTASARNDLAHGIEGPSRMYLVQVAVKTVQ